MLFDCRIRHNFSFHHGFPGDGSVDKRAWDNHRRIDAQAGRVDCYLNAVAGEGATLPWRRLVFVSSPCTIGLKNFIVREGLVVELFTDAHYMCDWMATPEISDWWQPRWCGSTPFMTNIAFIALQSSWTEKWRIILTVSRWCSKG